MPPEDQTRDFPAAEPPIGQDRTERTLGEDACLYLAAIVEGSQDAIISANLDGIILSWNHGAEVMFGHLSPEMIGQPVSRIVPPESLEESRRLTLLASQGPQQAEVIRMRRDGSRIHTSLTTSPIRDAHQRVVGVSGIHHDISAQKQVEESLRRNERRLAEAQRLAHVGSWELDLATGVTSWSDEQYRIYGVDPASFTPTYENFFNLVHPDDRARVQEEQDRAMYEQRPFRGQHRAIRQDGSIRTIHFECEVVSNDRGEPVRIVGTVQDITEQREAEGAIRELAAIVEASQDAIFSKTLDGSIISWNAGAQRMYGYSADEMRGRSVTVLVPEDRLEEHSRMMETIRRGGHVESIDTERLTREGRRIHVSISLSPITDPAGNVISASIIARDITQHKQAEEALRSSDELLRQAMKMEAVGRLAGGVAHDFNNLLTVILGSAQLFELNHGMNSPGSGEIEEIRKAANRASGLTQQLLAFSRRQVLEPRILDLNMVVGDTLKMLRRLIGEDVEILVRHDTALGRVLADPGQMEQVILNLAVNARDAMPSGGTLTIETRNADLDASLSDQGRDIVPGRYVVLAVTDTGCGISRENQTHLFEPFFSTKEHGKGTGLGLAMVFGVVKQSGGYICVSSEIGRGSTFKIYLPRVNGVSPTARPEKTEDRARGGTETVLLVEDEEQVRRISRRCLEISGYHVLEAENGVDALMKAGSHEGRIDLVVTDVVMPRMGGRELAERMTKLRPLARVLFVSGYTDDAIVHHDVERARLDFLQKPFTHESLARKVREVLDRAA